MSGALKTRVITAIILLLGLVAVAMFLPPLPFALIIGGIVMMAAWEWTGFIGLPDPVARLPYMLSILLALAGSWLLLGIEPDNADINRLASATVLTLGLLFWLLAFMLLRGYPDNTRKWNNRSGIALMGLMALVPTWVGIVQLKYLMPEGWLVLGLIVMVAAVDVGAFFAVPRSAIPSWRRNSVPTNPGKGCGVVCLPASASACCLPGACTGFSCH